MKTTIKLSIFIFLIISSGKLSAQYESAHWFFGNKSGMDFTDRYIVANAQINGVPGQTLSGVPRFVEGPINTSEGCLTASNSQGELLFSSDGINIYDCNGNLINPGYPLKGDPSSTSSGIVIPRPGYPHHYYIVTAPAAGTIGSGLFYYEIDMTLNGGSGDLIRTTPGGSPVEYALSFAGIYPDSYASENLAAISHDNAKDFWLVHRCRDYMFVWLVTENGIETNPLPSRCLATGYDPGGATHGYIKFSADGNYIANILHTNWITIGHFDNATGMISGIKNIPIPENGAYGYSLQFSPNGEYLYYSYIYVGPTYRVKVSDLLAGTLGTPKKIFDYVNNIQIGFDNRIYGIVMNTLNPVYGYRNLFVVVDPDEINPQTAVIPDYFPEGFGSLLSLPTFTSHFFSLDISIDPVPSCMKSLLSFSLQVTTGVSLDKVTRFDWDFGDGSLVVSDTDMTKTSFTQTHVYTKDGIYNLTITPFAADGAAMINKIFNIPIKINPCVLPVNPNMHLFQ